VRVAESAEERYLFTILTASLPVSESAGRCCPQCGQPVSGGLLSGLCRGCMVGSLMADVEGPSPFAKLEIEEPILTKVADYDVLRVIGRGGMGVVCRARDRLLGREVALKLMHSGVLASDEELRRFNTEAEAVARLRHPHLITIYEAGESDGQAFYTMTLAEGGTLASRLKDDRLPARVAAELLVKLAEAVHHAHTRGVLHRDIKPANVVFDSEGRPLVSDFGLARLTTNATVTRSGALLGTPAYLAPEVVSGKASHTTSSDVYALGVLFYECLTGRPPFAHESPLMLLKLIAEREPPAPSSLADNVDSDLEAICLHALEKEPAGRYSSAEALAEDLRHWLAGEPVSARRLPYKERFWRWAQRNQARAVLYTMTAVSLVILMVTSAVMNLVLADEQQSTLTNMRRSDERRAALLTKFSSRLLQTDDGWDEAAEYLREASDLRALGTAKDAMVALRLRILERLSDLEGTPWPTWTGEGLEAVEYDAEGQCVLVVEGQRIVLAAVPNDPQTGASSRRISGEAQRSLAIANDGSVKVSGYDLRLNRPASLAELSPDGQLVATYTVEGKLQLWESATGLAVSPALSLPQLKEPRVSWRTGDTYQLVVWSDTKAILLDW
jgi:serine/threonine protein kinase